MLQRFTVSNFLSFDSEQEFSMLPGKVEKFKDRLIQDEKLSSLKFCALYGANASGKSNLIKAMDFAKKVVISGVDYSSEDMYFKINEENKHKATKFEFEIKVKDSYYAYGFSLNLNESKIISEWLYEITPTSENLIFERDMVNGDIKYEIKFVDETNKSKFDVYIDDITNMDNVLFVSEINRKSLQDVDFEIFSLIFNWFKNILNIIYPDTEIGTIVKMFRDKSELDIVQVLEYFDTGISGYTLEPSSFEELKKYLSIHEFEGVMKFIKNPLSDKKKIKSARGTLKTDKYLFDVKFENDEWTISKLLFRHGQNCKTMFDFGEESDGTKRLIELLNIILSDNEGKIFVIDELDRSLHPQMTRKFIETFFKFTNGKNTQLFITTHESSLLNLEFLRRDEIWFVERDKSYSSKLYSLENFKVRYDKKVEKAYLEGRYGAVPIFKNFESYFGDKDEDC